MLRAARSLALVAGLAATAAGCSSSSTPSGTALRIDLAGGAFGARSYTLRCSPAGGTVVDAAALCRAIRRDDSLTASHSGSGHSCPFGPPAVHVTGRRDGRRVDARFSVCTSGQERPAAQWVQFVGYGPLWITQPGARRGGAAVVVRLHVPLEITRVFQSGIVVDLRISPHASGRTPAFGARVYPQALRGDIETHVKPGDYALSAAVRACNDNCGRLASPRHRCRLPFTASVGGAARLDVRLSTAGACIAQIEQHG